MTRRSQGAAAKSAPRPRSEADITRSTGTVQKKLRLSPQAVRRLALLAEDSGFTESEMVETMIDVAWSETPELRDANPET